MRDQSQCSAAIQPRFPATFAEPVRESLKGLRQVLYFGRDIVHDVVERSPLPSPVNALARTVLTEMDRVAGQVEGIATEVAREVLGEGTGTEGPILVPDDLDRQFAAGAASGLQAALDRLGASNVAVDQSALAMVHAALRDPKASEQDVARAALLVQGLLTDALQAPEGKEADFLPVAAFAVALWCLSDCTQDPAALAACTDLSAVLAPEIRQAVSDPIGLARLLEEFRDHV